MDAGSPDAGQPLEVLPAGDEGLCVVRVDGADYSKDGELTYGVTLSFF